MPTPVPATFAAHGASSLRLAPSPTGRGRRQPRCPSSRPESPVQPGFSSPPRGPPPASCARGSPGWGGVSSGALTPPPPSIARLSVLCTTLGWPPSAPEKRHPSRDRPELPFLPATLLAKRGGRCGPGGRGRSRSRRPRFQRGRGGGRRGCGRRPRVRGAAFGRGIVLALPLLPGFVRALAAHCFWELLDGDVQAPRPGRGSERCREKPPSLSVS